MVEAWLQLDVDSLRAAEQEITRGVLSAGKESIAETTRWLEQQLEEATRAGVPGRLWRAWASEVYPEGKRLARNPVGQVFVKGGVRSKGAMTFHTQPGRIVGRSEQWLAIPLPAAGSRGRGRDLTPGEWERRHGTRLRFVYRAGKSALLVADGATLSGRTGTFRPLTRKRAAADARRGFARGEMTVPIFVLVPFVPFKNSVAIDPLISSAEAKLVGTYEKRIGVVR